MQIALQDIRELGYRKIGLKYLGEGRERLLGGMKEVAGPYYGLKVPAFSFLAKAVSVLPECGSMRGYSMLVHSVAPLIGVDEVDAAEKRKFRNMWDSIWDGFGKAVGLAEGDTEFLKDFGLKALFMYSGAVSPKADAGDGSPSVQPDSFWKLSRGLDFVNSVMCWSVFTQHESSFVKNGYDVMDILRFLVEDTADGFVDRLMSLC